MKKIIVSLAAILLATSCTVSQKTAFLEVPDETKLEQTETTETIEPIDLKYYEDNYGDYDGVMISIEKTVEHTGQKEEGSLFNLVEPWYFHMIYKSRTVVLNPESDFLTNFELNTYMDVKKLYILVRDPDGSLRQYGLKDMIHGKNSFDMTEIKFAVPNVTKGTVIEYAYELGTSNYYMIPLEYVQELQHPLPAQYLKYEFRYPDWWELSFKKMGESRPIDFRTENDPAKHKKSIIYERHDIPPIPDEAFSPYFKEVAEYLEFQVSKFEMKGVSYNSPASWGEIVNDLFDEKIKKKGKKNVESIEEFTKKLIDSCSTNEGKIATIASFVRDSIELNYSDYDKKFADVLKKRKGWAWNTIGLANKMMQCAGLVSYVILAHDAEEGYFDRNYVNMSQFTAPALAVFADKQTYVIFPLIEDLPYDVIPEYFQGQPALMIRENPIDYFLTIPYNKDAGYTSADDVHARIDEDGTITVNETRSVQGMYAWTLRMAYNDLKYDELHEIFEEELKTIGVHFELDTVCIINLEDYLGPLQVSLTYKVYNLVSVLPDEAILNATDLLSPYALGRIDFETENRINPIKILNHKKNNYNIEIIYPESWEIASTLDSMSYTNEFGEISNNINLEPGKILIKQIHELNACLEPPEKITELADLIGAVSKLRIEPIVFKKGSSSLEQ